MKSLSFLIFFAVYTLTASAQIVISGRVSDANDDEPLVGANIKIMDEERGTITDTGGQFTLEHPGVDPIILVISYVGYLPDTVRITESSNIQVQLAGDYRLQEVVINAIRGDKQVPVTAFTIEKRKIDQVQVGQDAAFMLDELSPSLIAYSESGTNLSNYGQMRLRGIDQTRINITLDGAPLNDMIDQGVFFSNFIDFTNSVESIQVQRGVGTSTNGTSSYAGSINFESLDLRQTEMGAELQFNAGSFGSLRSSAELKTGLLKNNTAFYTRFTKINSDGYRYHTGTDAYSFFFSGGYYGKKDVIKLTGFTGQSKNGLAYLPVAISDINQDPRTNYVNENDIDDFGQDFIQLQYTRLINKRSSWVSSFYYGGAGGDFPAGYYVSDSIYSSSAPNGYILQENLIQLNYPLFNDHFGFTSYYNFQSSNEQFNLNAGMHLYTFKRINRESVLPDDAHPYYEEKSRKNEISLFTKAEYAMDKLTFYGDLQLRTLNLDIDPDEYMLPGQPNVTKSYTFLNPKIGLTFRLGNYQNFYVLYGFSGREPTKIDLLGGYQLTALNLQSVLSDDVKPEYVNDFEAGFRIFSPSLSGQVNLFYMNFINEIAPIGAYVPEGFIQLRKNIPSSFRAGIEFDWNWYISESLTFTGNATYMESRIDQYEPEEDPNTYENVTQPLSPRFMGSGSINYALKDFMFFEIGGKMMSESFLEPTNQTELIMPGFFIANAKIGFLFMGKHELDLFINNIFNKKYYTYGAPVDPEYDGTFEPGYFVQPPRSFMAALKLRF